MGNYAIKIEGLGKRYRIGERQKYKALRDVLADVAYAPVRAAGRLLRGEGRGAREDSHIWALKDVSFEVQHGEVLGVIGRNGAGKSTLLKILSRITEPTEGEVRLRGRVGSLLEVGTGFHPELTGRENVYLNGAILGMHRHEIERKFDEIVAFAEIEKFLDTPVKHYSSGMYVRLAFAVAAHLEPEILLVDEVLAVGDVAFQRKCLGKMGAVAGEGRTVLFVSHNMGAVRTLCRRVILLDCRVLMDGPADDVVDRYLASDMWAEMGHSSAFPRPDDSEAWIESASVLCNGQGGAMLKMGESLSLEIRFRCTRPTRQPGIGFVIKSAEGDAVLNANNRYQPSQPLSKPVTQGVVRCNLGAVPLMANRYSVSLWFGIDAEGRHQHIENALAFEVVEQDLWGTDRLPSRRISAFWWPTDFQYGPVEVTESEQATT